MSDPRARSAEPGPEPGPDPGQDPGQPLDRTLFPDAHAAYDANDMPFLQRARRLAVRTRPYRGLKILHNVPLTVETLFKIEVLALGGAALTISSPSFMRPHADALAMARRAGLRLALPEGLPGDLAEGPAKDPAKDRVDELTGALGDDYDLCLDCAGELAGRVTPRIGTVELTRTGANKYAAMAPRHPILCIDDSRVKDLETLLGTGDGFLRAFLALSGADIRGRRFLLFGYGKVGRGIVQALRPHTRDVVVVDIDPRLVEAARGAGMDAIHAGDTRAVEAAARSAFAVVTATGRPSVISGAYDPEAFRGRHLANLGGDDEFGPRFADDEVLFRKQPINFAIARPTAMRYLDPVFHAHNLGVDLLRFARLEPGVHPFPAFLADDMVAQWERIFGESIDY